FIFRRLGLCFDYASDPDDFPRRPLPTAREARNRQPNAAGLGSGIAYTAWNNGLLLDGYLLRLEIGLGGEAEERILDRLIGGLIRLATTAPRNYVVRGLTADGRGFYPAVDVDSYLLWSFSLWRAYTTAAIALESQTKMHNIAKRWIERLERDGFRIPLLEGEGENPDGDLAAADGARGPKLLAILAVAGAVTREDRWFTRLSEKAASDGGCRLSAAAAAGAREILSRQIAYYLLHHLNREESLKPLIAERLLENARAALAFLDSFRRFAPEEYTDKLDWRAGGGPDWPRARHESETIAASLEAGLTLLLSGERDLIQPQAAALESCLRSVPWQRLCLASAIAPAISLHARGCELGLWDQDLLSRPKANAEESLVAKYLAEDFDRLHPHLAGHSAPAEEEEVAAAPFRPGRRRRRRRH
ncbi:MAG: hypothetical protein N3A66_09625, partial [Planctomycetota bacterium]|nr:hypothetical protein [Planctomycetota bacterium]